MSKQRNKTKSRFNVPRGDTNGIFNDDWLYSVVSPKSNLLQSLRKGHDVAEENSYNFVRIKFCDLEILDEQ